MKKGMKADQFGLDYLSGMVVSLNTRIREEAQTLGLTLQEIKVESKLSAIQTIAATVSSQLTTLEQAKLNSVKQLTMHLSDLKELHRRLSDAIENITSVYGVPPSEVSRELTALQIQLQEKHKQLEKLRKTIGDVGSSFALFQGVESEMERLGRMVSQIGDESTIKTTLDGLEGEKKRREEEASKLDVYTKLLLLGLDYAETASTSKCPICHTSVDQNQIMNHIHAELATLQTSSEAKATKQRIEQLTEAIETARKKMVQLQSFNLQLKETSERHRKILGEIKGLIGKDNVEDVLAINFFLEGLKADAATLENSILTLRDEASKREAGMAEYNEQLKTYEKAKSEVQSLLSSNLDGRDLLSLLDREVKKAEDSLAAIDRKGVEELRTKLETISELINYHVLAEAIKDLEAEMPRKESELKSVEECLRNLEEVELSLNEIRRAAMLEQQDWVADILPKIQSSLAESFNCLTSHPLFSKLSIMVEDIRGKNVYWIAVSTEDGTKSYVQTKFSTAQLNATALAIFLTMSRYLAHNLGFIVMDDPSQSMDDAHKRSLAKFLADEINHRQVIIATQDKEFTSYLSKLTPRRLKVLDVEAGNPRF